MDFIGSWHDGESTYAIDKVRGTYQCSFNENNIGIAVGNHLLVAEFPVNTTRGGVGVYVPVGDGRSFNALLASLGSHNELGSGIVVRRGESDLFTGEYRVQYFIGDHESPVYQVTIDSTDDDDIFTGAWIIDDNIVHRGILLAFDDKYAIAYGDPDGTFDIRVLKMCVEEQQDMLRSTCVQWKSLECIKQKFIRSLHNQ